jgi:hypothetical protein
MPARGVAFSLKARGPQSDPLARPAARSALSVGAGTGCGRVGRSKPISTLGHRALDALLLSPPNLGATAAEATGAFSARTSAERTRDGFSVREFC